MKLKNEIVINKKNMNDIKDFYGNITQIQLNQIVNSIIAMDIQKNNQIKQAEFVEQKYTFPIWHMTPEDRKKIKPMSSSL